MSSTTRPSASSARSQILEQLKNDHDSVTKACRRFKALDSDEAAYEATVRQVLRELQMHAALEEELLYPAARSAETGLIDQAKEEHESLHRQIGELNSMHLGDEKFAARFTALCECVRQHVRHEEGEIFPALERARLDWDELATAMQSRREQLVAIADAAGAPRSRRTGKHPDNGVVRGEGITSRKI
jgi:hemerythrin superfamily protein